MIFVELFINMSLMENKIMNVNKHYWAAQKRIEKLTAEMTSMIIARFPSLIPAVF